MSSHRKTVSVVITCYNQGQFVSEAINSVIAQKTDHDIEIIVVDDGSKDDTAQAIKQFNDVHYIQQKNQGVVAARNHGLGQAKGNYIIFLDGDDRLLPDALQIGVTDLEAHPQCAFVYGRCRLIDSLGAEISIPHIPFVEKNHYAQLLRENFIWMPAVVMYRRSVFESVGGFNPTANHSSDYELYLRITRKFPVHCHSKVVADYRHHRDNVTHNSALLLSSTIGTHRTQWKYVKGNKELEEHYQRGLKFWREFYGERTAEKIRRRMRSHRELRQAASDALILLQYSPRILARHLMCKLRRVLTLHKKEHLTEEKF